MVRSLTPNNEITELEIMKLPMSMDKFSLIRRETNLFNAMGIYLMFNGVPYEDIEVFLTEFAEANRGDCLNKPNYWLIASCDYYLNSRAEPCN